MKLILLCPFIALMNLSESIPANNSSYFSSDTTIITHLLDGYVNEWPAEKFNADKGNRIQFAKDNDHETLFLALTISDRMMQQKIIQQGLNLYLDPKGKKKENRGVEFPVVGSNVNPAQSMTSMKLFGFSNEEVQNIKTAETINIALAWDSSYIMHIEYNVPLKMIEGINGKTISIGWKINDEPNISQPAVTSTSTRVVGVPAGSRSTSSRSGGSSRTDQTQQSNTGNVSRSQSIWTDHIIKF
jgi:hypothetical protein